MTVEKCYEIMKGDYKDVLSRLSSDDKIKKFLVKLSNDSSFADICLAMDNHNMEEAFRATHTLKGLSKNLSLTGLAYSASNLAEALRDRKNYGEDLEPLFKKMKKDYALTMACIQML